MIEAENLEAMKDHAGRESIHDRQFSAGPRATKATSGALFLK